MAKFYLQLVQLYDLFFLPLRSIHRCLKIGGETVLKRWLQSQEELVQCFMEEFQVFTIQDEIEESKQKGELELVFQKYCR